MQLPVKVGRLACFPYGRKNMSSGMVVLQVNIKHKRNIYDEIELMMWNINSYLQECFFYVFPFYCESLLQIFIS